MRPRDYLLVVAINLVWAFNVVAVKLSVTGVAPITAAFIRYAIVLAACLPFLRLVPGRMPRLLGVAVSQGALWIVLLNLAFAKAHNIAALSLVGQLGVVFSLVLAVVFLGERIHTLRIVAIGVAILGVCVIGFDRSLFSEGEALWFAVLAALSYSCGSILLRGLAVKPFTLFAWIGVTSLPLLLASSLLVEPGALAAAFGKPLWTLWPIAYSALFSSLVGHAGFAYLVQRYEISQVSPLLLPSPVLSAALAVLVLGDDVTSQLVFGGLLVVAGVAVITVRTHVPVRR